MDIYTEQAINLFGNQINVLEYQLTKAKKPNAYIGVNLKINNLHPISANTFINKYNNNEIVIRKFLKKYEIPETNLHVKNIEKITNEEIEEGLIRKKQLLKQGEKFPNQYRALKYTYLNFSEKNYEGLQVKIKNLEQEVGNYFIKKLKSLAIKSFRKKGYERNPESLKDILNQFVKDFSKHNDLNFNPDKEYEHFDSCEKIYQYVQCDFHDENKMNKMLKQVAPFIDINEIKENRINYLDSNLKKYELGLTKEELEQNVRELIKIKEMITNEDNNIFNMKIVNLITSNFSKMSNLAPK